MNNLIPISCLPNTGIRTPATLFARSMMWILWLWQMSSKNGAPAVLSLWATPAMAIVNSTIGITLFFAIFTRLGRFAEKFGLSSLALPVCQRYSTNQ